jgi:uncharacterized protein YkwD
MRILVAGVVLACATFGTIPANTAAVAAASRTALTITMESGAYELYLAQNAVRSDAGVPAVRVNPLLQELAQRQADRMALYQVYDHADPLTGDGPRTRAWTAGYRLATNVAEVIDRGPSTASGVLDAFRQSSIHWDTVVDGSFNDAGFGHATDAAGRQYWVIDYGASVNAQGTPVASPIDTIATVVATPMSTVLPTPVLGVATAIATPTAGVATPSATPRPKGTTRVYLPSVQH